MVVVLDKGGDLCLELRWKVMVLQQDAVLKSLMPALDLVLGLRMAWCAADMFDVVIVEPCRQIA
jgi:hypothetical protein